MSTTRWSLRGLPKSDTWQEALVQQWGNAGTASKTLAQHYPTAGPTFRVCWNTMMVGVHTWFDSAQSLVLFNKPWPRRAVLLWLYWHVFSPGFVQRQGRTRGQSVKQCQWFTSDGHQMGNGSIWRIIFESYIIVKCWNGFVLQRQIILLPYGVCILFHSCSFTTCIHDQRDQTSAAEKI